MSEKHLKNQSNNNNLRLKGDKINLEVRPLNQLNPTTIKTNNLFKQYYHRPVSAVPLLALNEDDIVLADEIGKDRPFSADFRPYAEPNDLDHLRSSKLLKTLLSEPIKSWRNSSIIAKNNAKQTTNCCGASETSVVANKKIQFVEGQHNDPGIDAIHDYLTIKYEKADDFDDNRSMNSVRIEENDGKFDNVGCNQQKLQIQNWIDSNEIGKLPELSKVDIDGLFKDELDRRFDKSPKTMGKPNDNKNRVKFVTNPIEPTEPTAQNDKNSNYLDFLDSFDDLAIIDDEPEKDNDGIETTTTNSESNEDIATILQVLEAEHEKSQKNMKQIQQIIDKEITPKIVITDVDKNKNNNNNNNQNQLEGKEEVHDEGIKVETEQIDTKKSIDLHPETTLSKSSSYNQLLSFLDEVDKNCSKPLDEVKSNLPKFDRIDIRLDTIPKYEDLIHYRNEELARHVIDLSLRLNDKSSSIKLLQTELSNLREQIIEQNRKQNAEIKIKLKTQKDEYESTIKRHQKFIDQLINDKKSLNQQCESLIKDIKVSEQRYESNLKSIEHKHHVEIEKLKNIQTINEKIRRERWIDNRTQKIKEQTVKSIEPELKNMEKRQQQELHDLRALHKHEIDDLELKHARKMQQQLETLRMEMLEERERLLKNERELVQKRYDNLIENEQKSVQEQRKRLLNEHQQRIRECEERENNVNIERDRTIKQIQNEYEERVQTVLRRHANEIDLIKESINIELEQWKNNYKKQQQIHLNQHELELREKLRKERDLEIEKVIERLDNESSEQRKQTEQTTENRMKRLKEKYEKEINDLEISEHQYKSKYNDLKQQILNNDDTILNLNNRIKQQQQQLDDNQKLIEQLQNERQQFKDLARREMNNEMETLNKELMMVKACRDKELQQLHSRVRVSVARKDQILSELTRDNKSLQEKCAYLESMLEQQRKEYLIK